MILDAENLNILVPGVASYCSKKRVGEEVWRVLRSFRFPAKIVNFGKNDDEKERTAEMLDNKEHPNILCRGLSLCLFYLFWVIDHRLLNV